MDRNGWRFELSDVHLVWLGLAAIFVLVALAVVALSLLPVRDRR